MWTLKESLLDPACCSEQEVAAAGCSVDVVHPPTSRPKKAALLWITITNRGSVSGGTGMTPKLDVVLRVAVTILRFPIGIESSGDVAEAACLDGGGDGGASAVVLRMKRSRMRLKR